MPSGHRTVAPPGPAKPGGGIGGAASGSPLLFNEPRLRAMMERNGLDLLFIASPVNSKYLSGFFHNSGDHDGTVGARPFVVLYFLDEARAPALLVPAVDL
ncbi:MAG: aminopeptidase P family N-terminal domain-containing protein, partial [Kiloniellales bacterium]